MCCLKGVLFKISDEQPPFFYLNPPGPPGGNVKLVGYGGDFYINFQILSALSTYRISLVYFSALKTLKT